MLGVLQHFAQKAERYAQHFRQLSVRAGRESMAHLRPQCPSSVDSERARSGLASAEPTRFPGLLPLYVGSAVHAEDLTTLKKLQVEAVICVGASRTSADEDVRSARIETYAAHGIAYLELARVNERTRLVHDGLGEANEAISTMHAQGRVVLIHCSSGINDSAALAIAHLLLTSQRNLLELFAECIAASPSILQDRDLQQQYAPAQRRTRCRLEALMVREQTPPPLLPLPPPPPISAAAPLPRPLYTLCQSVSLSVCQSLSVTRFCVRVVAGYASWPIGTGCSPLRTRPPSQGPAYGSRRRRIGRGCRSSLRGRRQ
jgi:hypothetical protein